MHWQFIPALYIRVLTRLLCETSLAYAIRKTDELQIGDLNYYQADINLIGNWTNRFDLVECCGSASPFGFAYRWMAQSGGFAQPRRFNEDCPLQLDGPSRL